MRYFKNRDGVALVTSLMLTLISLTIVMALLLMITRSTTVSAMNKRYKTSLEAAYGGTELITKDIFPIMLRSFDNATFATDVNTAFSAVSLQVNAADAGTLLCFRAKMSQPSSLWPVGCSRTPNPKDSPDMTLTLTAVSGNPFTVYAKIVDTQLGNTERSGLQLEGAGVAETRSVITPQHFPYIYRMEIQSERQNTVSGQANIEVLYAY